jgi:hypothetical protein
MTPTRFHPNPRAPGNARALAREIAMVATVYIICLIVGGGLLLLSSVFSGHHGGDVSFDQGVPHATFDHPTPHFDHNVSTDSHHVDHSISHGDHASHFSLATWFSIQFVIYFVAVFGLVGTTLSYGSDVASGWVLVAAFLAAVLVGQLVHQSMRFLKRTGQGSEISTADFVNKPARVTITINPPRHGEVAVPLHSGERFVSAVAKRPDDKFRVGDRVVVVTFRNGVAEVVSKEEYEFVSGKEAGAAT